MSKQGRKLNFYKGASPRTKQVEVPEEAVERLADELLLYRFGGHFSDDEYFINHPEHGSRAHHREQALDNARRILAEDRLAIYKHFSDRLLSDEAVAAACKQRWPLWVAMKPEQKAAARKLARADLKAALQAASIPEVDRG
jgi:hypothetical protein